MDAKNASRTKAADAKQIPNKTQQQPLLDEISTLWHEQVDETMDEGSDESIESFGHRLRIHVQKHRLRVFVQPRTMFK